MKANRFNRFASHCTDEKLISIGCYIYDLFSLGLIEFDVCADSLQTINSLCENTWVSMPEVDEAFAIGDLRDSL